MTARRRANSSAALADGDAGERSAVSSRLPLGEEWDSSRTTGAPPAQAARARSFRPAASAAMAAGVPRLVKAAMTPSWPIRGRLENYRIPAGGLFPGGDYPQTLS